jgi:hypothetical protein
MRRATGLAAVLAVATVTGCADIGTKDETERVQQPQLVHQAEIDRYPKGSPAWTLLAWWRALQFNAPANAVAFYDSRVPVTKQVLQQQLLAGPALGLNDRPRVFDVDEQGDKATVYVLLAHVVRNPNGRNDETRTPRAFNLVRDGGEWKLADNEYIAHTLRETKAFIKAGTRNQSKKK